MNTPSAWKAACMALLGTDPDEPHHWEPHAYRPVCQTHILELLTVNQTLTASEIAHITRRRQPCVLSTLAVMERVRLVRKHPQNRKRTGSVGIVPSIWSLRHHRPF